MSTLDRSQQQQPIRGFIPWAGARHSLPFLGLRSCDPFDLLQRLAHRQCATLAEPRFTIADAPSLDPQHHQFLCAAMESDEPRWELFRADLKMSKMVIKQPRPSLRFHIPIPAQARYEPGRVAPPRVDLQLVHDTSALIHDKIILPPGLVAPPGDLRQRRVYYIIGWPDLPAARPVVDATRILDYVSPRALEDWEYRDFQRRRAQEEEAAKEAMEAAVAAAKGKGPVVPYTEFLPNGKKKRGRKPKHARMNQVRAPTPQLDSEQEQDLARRKSVPSLSTPQKGRIAQMDVEMEMLDITEDSADNDQDEDERMIYLGAEGEAWDLHDNREANMSAKVGAVGLLKASSAVSSVENLSRPSSQSPAPPPPSQKKATSKASSTARGSKPKSVQHTPSTFSTKQRRPPAPSTSFAQQQRPPAAAAAISGHIPQIQSRKPISTTPIPLPPRPIVNTKISQPAPFQTLNSTSGLNSIPISHAQKPSPSPTPIKSGITTTMTQFSPTAPLSGSQANSGFTPTNGFTPIGRPPKRSANGSPPRGGEDDATNTPSSTAVKKERKKAPRLSKPASETKPKAEPASNPAEEIPVQQEWVVKRLEGHDVVDGVHYFKVRWEGDWPPGQNPSWEPQENISDTLVRKYLKRESERAPAQKTKTATAGPSGSGRGAHTPQQKKQKQPQQTTLAQWAKGYSSVSEAFEGQAELEAPTSLRGSGSGGGLNGGAAGQSGGGDEYDDNGDELLVVDEGEARQQQKAAAERRKSLGAQVMAQFASLVPGRRNDY